MSWLVSCLAACVLQCIMSQAFEWCLSFVLSQPNPKCWAHLVCWHLCLGKCLRLGKMSWFHHCSLETLFLPLLASAIWRTKASSVCHTHELYHVVALVSPLLALPFWFLTPNKHLGDFLMESSSSNVVLCTYTGGLEYSQFSTNIWIARTIIDNNNALMEN